MPCASDEVRGLWWDQRCPTNTDALQIATEALLDAADHIVGTGLAGVGYTVLAMPSCPLLQMPSHREAIAHYFAERGLSLVFAPVVEDDPGASLLSDILFFGADRTVRGAAARAAHRHEEARAPTGEAPPAEAAGSCAQLYLQKLASLSGLGGWNDPRTHLPARPHLASARLNRSRVEPTRPLAIGPPIDVVATELRSHFALACVRAAPLILSTPPHRLSRDARRIVTDTVRFGGGIPVWVMITGVVQRGRIPGGGEGGWSLRGVARPNTRVLPSPPFTTTISHFPPGPPSSLPAPPPPDHSTSPFPPLPCSGGSFHPVQRGRLATRTHRGSLPRALPLRHRLEARGLGASLRRRLQCRAAHLEP